jgi:tetratricopeptide (TPR) repeat protein
MVGCARVSALAVALFGVLLMPAMISAQDLGSVNGLFSPKSAKKSKTKKAKPKPKTTAAKKSSTSKKRSSTQKTNAKKKGADLSSKNSPPRTVAKKAPKESEEISEIPALRTGFQSDAADSGDVVITVGTDSSANFAELFDDSIASGNTARNRRLYEDAEKAYIKAQAIDPDDYRAVYGLGNVYSDQQRWEEAEAYYRKALKIEPDSSMANIALSYVLTQPVAGSNLGERYAEAEAIARKAISLDSDNAVGFDQLGVSLELRGFISAETEEAYRKAIQLDSTFALAYAHLGRLLRKNGKTNESSAVYRNAIQLAKDVPTMILVADVMQSQQRYLDSEQLLREALRRDPKNPTGLYLLGKALTTRKSFEEAEEVLKKSIEVSPGSFVSYALLSYLYSQNGDLLKAEQTLIRTLSIVTKNEERRLAREFEQVGDGFASKRRYRDAARVFRRALILDSTKSSISEKLANAESQK